MLSSSKLQRAHRTEASANLALDLEREQLNPTAAQLVPAPPAVKRARPMEKTPSTPVLLEESSLVISEESCHPTSSGVERAATTVPAVEAKKWNGKKERMLSLVLSQAREGSFLRNTDTLNLGDVWFLPLKVERGTSKMIISVTVAIIVNGTSLIMNDHTYKMNAEELLKMIYLCKKMRSGVFPTRFPYSSYGEWHDKEQEFFLTSSEVVRGDGSEAALAEYEFSKENFRLRLEKTCPLYCVFRKINQHIYVNDVSSLGAAVAPTLYGSVDNPNIELCSALRGTYSFAIEVRMMWVERSEEERTEEVPESQPY